ncbi:MAG: hypothetical protein ABIM74_11010, partial [candidate division WOR-3 bacterium]
MVFQKCDHRIRPSDRHGVIVPREEKLIRELLSLSPSTAYRLMRAADTCEHSGGFHEGRYIHTLTITDIRTGWTLLSANLGLRAE